MAHIHVLERYPATGAVRVALHIPIPDVQNPRGIAYRTAIVRSGKGGTSVLAVGAIPDTPGPGEIAQSELTSIEAGALVECVETLRLETGGETNAELLATLDAHYTMRVAQVQQQLHAELKHYGFTRVVS